MKSITYQGEKRISVLEKPEPVIKHGTDVKVKITLAGICGTDLRIYTGNFDGANGITLGHEAIGIVEDIGTDVISVKMGDRVLLDPTLYCGNCYFCKKGLHHLCNYKEGTETGVDKEGAFAEYIIMPENFVYRLSDTLSDERAVLIEPLACVLNNINAANLKYDDDVLIIGGGPIGAIYALLSEKYGLSTSIVETKSERIRFIQKILPNITVIDGKKQKDWVAMTKKPSVVVDATGSMLEEAVKLVRKGGTVVAMGFNSKYVANINALYITNNAIKIVGAGDYNNMFISAMEVAEKYELEKLITHTFSIDKAKEAFELLTSNDVIDELVMKVVFKL